MYLYVYIYIYIIYVGTGMAPRGGGAVRTGQVSALTDSSWSKLNIDRLELVKFVRPPPIAYPWSHPCKGCLPPEGAGKSKQSLLRYWR